MVASVMTYIETAKEKTQQQRKGENGNGIGERKACIIGMRRNGGVLYRLP